MEDNVVKQKLRISTKDVIKDARERITQLCIHTMKFLISY